MANKAAGEVRAPQLVGMFGPGSIVSLETLSVMPTTPERWIHAATISSPTFERQIGAATLLDTSSMAGGIDAVIFPQMFVCRVCGLIQKRSGATEQEIRNGLSCAKDGGRLYPSRWVTYCRLCHVDDFDYSSFVHKGQPCDRDVRIRTGASINETLVHCDCGSQRSMRDAYQWTKGRRCSGRQPWISESTFGTCEEQPKLSMRSSSDIYFSATRSAITIEPESKPLVREVIAELSKAAASTQASPERAVQYLKMGRFESVSDAELIAAYNEFRHAATQPGDYRDRRRQEFEALSTASGGPSDDLWVETVESHGLERFNVAQICAVRRLREVRAIVGFQRGAVPVDPTFELADQDLPVHQFGPTGARRFPAYENRGEGIFFSFDPRALREWLDREVVARRSESFFQAEEIWRQTTDRAGVPQRRAIFVLAHSFAHIMIRQLALVSGYSQASLRERVFASADDVQEPWAGALIYTSSSDADGSLGGLVAQATEKNLGHILTQALDDLRVCSSDPVCALQLPSGFRKLNAAACHSCLVLPETCCERNNAFLDRTLVVPETVHPESGALCFVELSD